MKEERCLHRDIVRIMMVLALLGLTLLALFGEKVTYNEGAGWDGLFYRDVARNFSTEIGSSTYDLYRIQRILPFAVENLFLEVTRLEKSNTVLLSVIGVENLLILCLGVWSFFRICKRLKFSLAVEMIGFSAFFYNFPILKLMGYYPFLTDTCGIVLAIVQIDCFLSHKRVQLILWSVLGAFSWPTLFITGLILYAFPQGGGLVTGGKMGRGSLDGIVFGAFRVSAILFIPLAFGFLVFFFPSKLLGLYAGESFSSWPLVLVSLSIVMFYFYYTLKYLPTLNLGRFFRGLQVRNLLVAVLLFVGVYGTQYLLSSKVSLVSFQAMIVGRIVLPSTVDPGVFAVSDILYYGPIIVLLLLKWRPVTENLRDYGSGYFLVFVLAIVMFVNSESRHLLSYFPFLVLPLMVLLNKSPISYWRATLFSLVCLGVSRFWLVINIPGINEGFARADYTHFPAQSFFMTQGPWLSHNMYYVFLVVAVAMVPLVYFIFREKLTKG